MAAYDKDREGHYNLISALHKAVRGSDPQARSIIWRACWWRARSRCSCSAGWCGMASEDIGLADPQALVQCLAAKDSYDFLGSPEGELADRQCLPVSGDRAANRTPAMSRGRPPPARHARPDR
jgi:putative ATPase